MILTVGVTQLATFTVSAPAIADTVTSTAVATLFWMKLYTIAAVVQTAAVVSSLALVLFQLRAFRSSLALSIYGSTYKSLAQVNEVALMRADIAEAMNWGSPINVFIWRLVSHFEFIFNLRRAGHIPDSDWDAELEFLRECCDRRPFRETWGTGSKQFNKAFSDFLTKEVSDAEDRARAPQTPQPTDRL
jgi:hypothetical protein